jgi:peptide methionine sulfoxide reductase msrA/msrB
MIRGVISVIPGFAGGHTPNPTYEDVANGDTGHAEVIRLEYDPAAISFRDILTVYFGSHDPTTVNRQGNDVGTQYRSIILYTIPEQKILAENFIQELNASSQDGRAIVTEVAPLTNFYEADDSQKNFYERNKDSAYCEIVINPKLQKVVKEYAQFLKEDELKKTLTPEAYHVLREKGTEAPFTGKYVHETRKGIYSCLVCGNDIFKSESKFDSGTGWPSFDEAIPGSVVLREDKDLGMTRTEVVCAKCGSHLGHVFDDGPTKTGKRYCLNSVCLDFDGK